MKKITLATAILFTLTGCGSSGGSSHNLTPNSEVNNNQAVKIQVDKQKTEDENKTQKQLPIEKQNPEKEQQQSQTEQKNQIRELAKILTDLQVSDDDIENFIQNNAHLSLNEAKSNLDAKITDAINRLKAGGPYTAPLDKPLGFLAKQDLSTTKKAILEGNNEKGSKKVTKYTDIYNQKYSVIIGEYNKTEPYGEADKNKIQTNETYTVYDGSYKTNGFKTPIDKFPSEGKATYTGVAFDSKKQGSFSYIVNFMDRKGSGKITGLDHIGDITLRETEIYNSAAHDEIRAKGDAIADDWSSIGDISGEYVINFFGPNAEEISGKVRLNSEDVYKFSYNESNNNGIIHIKDVMITNDPASRNINSFSPRGNIDIGFGGTRDNIQK